VHASKPVSHEYSGLDHIFEKVEKEIHGEAVEECDVV